MSTSHDSIDESVKPKIYTQSYTAKPAIEGLKILTLKHYPGEDSDFVELMRLDGQGESQLIPGFHVSQINYSTMLPGSVKAWHLHEGQDEAWYVPDRSRLLAAFWDIRKDSPTKNNVVRIPMGEATQRMVYIPRGVAHGMTNLTHRTGMILYFMNNRFNPADPDEHRLPWDSLGAGFWQAQRD